MALRRINTAMIADRLASETDPVLAGEQLKLARHALGWSLAELVDALMLEPGDAAERRIREMEAGKRDISGPIRVAMLAYLDGWKPERL